MLEPNLKPDLNLLAALDVLLAEASVAGAARRLGLSASAMSRTLARLREATGDALLVRAGRGMVLTPHAEAIRERTRHTLEEAQALLRPSVTEHNIATLERRFTIRANDGFVEAFGAALIAAVAAEAPLVSLRFAPKLEKSAAPLREGLADLEIGVLGEMGPEVRVQALFRDRFVGAARKGHAAVAEPLTPARYAALGHIVASRHDRARGPVDEALDALGLRRAVVTVVPSFQAALAVALDSDLLALLPASFLERAQAAETVHVFELPVATKPITILQMWHPRSDADLAHCWLRQLVRRVVQQRRGELVGAMP